MRKSLILVVKKKMMLTSILTTKIIEFFVKWFNMIRKVPHKCIFFYLKSDLKNKFELEKIFF